MKLSIRQRFVYGALALLAAVMLLGAPAAPVLADCPTQHNGSCTG